MNREVYNQLITLKTRNVSNAENDASGRLVRTKPIKSQRRSIKVKINEMNTKE